MGTVTTNDAITAEMGIDRMHGNTAVFVWCLTARQHRIGQFVPTAGAVAYPEIQNGGGGVRHLGPLPSPPLSLWRALASLENFFWTKDARRCVLSAFSTQK